MPDFKESVLQEVGKMGPEGKGQGVGEPHTNCWLQHHLVSMLGEELCTLHLGQKGSRDQFCQSEERQELLMTIKEEELLTGATILPGSF